jgi:DNA-binding transcriptional ArsR family regulator/chemotaxis protein CheY-P-specific phosphatase CheC
MTLEINEFKDSQSKENRRDILNILKVLGEAQVEQIREQLLKRAKERVDTLYENGEIDLSKKKKLIKENTISKRTIHRHLDSLAEQKLVEHIGYKYRLTDRVKNDIRYWSSKFGDLILDKMLRNYFPQTQLFEQNVDEIIKIFGVYMVYCFIQAAQPGSTFVNRKMSKTDIMNSDKVVLSWIQEVVKPQRMLGDFITIMSNLLEDEKIISVPKRGNPIIPKTANDICMISWFERAKPSSYDTVKKPLFQMDQAIIDKIMDVLERKYSRYHEPIMQVLKYYYADLIEKHTKKKDVISELDINEKKN